MRIKKLWIWRSKKGEGAEKNYKENKEEGSWGNREGNGRWSGKIAKNKGGERK